MTIVYLDSFLLVNFILNFLLLLASGKLAGEELHKWRFALAALLGAGYAALTFFPNLRIFLHPAYKISAAMLMLLISFGRSRRLIRISAIFLALSCAFCGGILAIEFLKGASYMKDGMVYSTVDVKGLLMSALFCYGVLSLFFRRGMIHHTSKRELVDVTIRHGGNLVQLTALVDSGNTLQDPVNGRSVPVVEGEKLKTLFPDDWLLSKESLEQPIKAMERLAEEGKGTKLRLLPYRAVGVDCGMLLAVKLDQMDIGGKIYQEHLVALSPTPLSDGGGYNALIGCR
ncbi:MAG: Sporulation sigma-E factor processing peptidase (SpoIIGA) [Firmicutes bacterium]|nr:Sporulation sigma-E factor processing peptidase (SpoIIGA) [Bacillota bacterium]